MKKQTIYACLVICCFLVVGNSVSRAQEPATPSRLTNPIIIYKPSPSPETANGASSTDTVRPANTVAQPDIQALLTSSEGVLVETLDGATVVSKDADTGFNPASAVKLITALAALKTFGPDHRCDTGLWTNGSFDKATGTITGDLIISGRDPSFHYEHVVELAEELNQMGIRTVTGDLVVPNGFTLNFDASAQRSGDQFYDALDTTRRPKEAFSAWCAEQTILGNIQKCATPPSVAVMGAVYVAPVPKDARMLLLHHSSRLIDILKVVLCFSNNFMAERIGDLIGGPDGVRRVAINDAGVNPDEIKLSSTNGLGVNRVTPRAMLKIYRALSYTLANSHLTMSDLLPVAGIDPGTLQKRYTDSRSRGSVIAKTGTLTHTDGGTSALVGQMQTSSGGTLLFAIFNRGGNILRSRTQQDTLVTQIQNDYGGPLSFPYQALTLAMRLADTQIHTGRARTGEFEPEPN